MKVTPAAIFSFCALIFFLCSFIGPGLATPGAPLSLGHRRPDADSCHRSGHPGLEGRESEGVLQRRSSDGFSIHQDGRSDSSPEKERSPCLPGFSASFCLFGSSASPSHSLDGFLLSKVSGAGNGNCRLSDSHRVVIFCGLFVRLLHLPFPDGLDLYLAWDIEA